MRKRIRPEINPRMVNAIDLARTRAGLPGPLPGRAPLAAQSPLPPAVTGLRSESRRLPRRAATAAPGNLPACYERTSTGVT